MCVRRVLGRVVRVMLLKEKRRTDAEATFSDTHILNLLHGPHLTAMIDGSRGRAQGHDRVLRRTCVLREPILMTSCMGKNSNLLLSISRPSEGVRGAALLAICRAGQPNPAEVPPAAGKAEAKGKRK